MDENMENNNDRMNPYDPNAAGMMRHSSSIGMSNASQIVSGNGRIALDLVVIIDTSGSMSDESQDLSQQIDTAIEKASTNCPSQLRATFLGIQGIWDGTKFDQSVSEYLIAHGANEGGFTSQKAL